MKFTATALPGVFLIDLEPAEDERGFFARTFCAEEMRAHGLEPHVAQTSISFSRRRGTLRGLHYQLAPYEETKLVRVARGAIYDVVVDLVSGRWLATELRAAGGRMLYVPRGCAHGFQTLEDDTEISYVMSMEYVPDAAAGIRWDDPAFAIEWPLEITVISDRDRAWPDYRR